MSTVQSNDNPWFTNFDPGGGLPGGNIAIDDALAAYPGEFTYEDIIAAVEAAGGVI